MPGRRSVQIHAHLTPNLLQKVVFSDHLVSLHYPSKISCVLNAELSSPAARPDRDSDPLRLLSTNYRTHSP